MRLWNFAQVLASRGHRVVVLTSDHGMEGELLDPEQGIEDFAAHDWGHPFHLPIAQPPSRWVDGVRVDDFSKPLRSLIIAYAYLSKSGMFHAWTKAVTELLPPILAEFTPDWVWATFGNTDSLAIAREVANRCECRWALDLKDPWENFIPRGLQTLVSRRFRDAALRTANGELQGKGGERWFGGEIQTLYSGFWKQEIRPEGVDCEPGRIQFFGHMNSERLDDLAAWWLHLVQQKSLPPGPWKFAYAGGAGDRFTAAFGQLEAHGVQLEVEAYLPLNALMERCRRSAAIAYTCDLGKNPIHHKAIEILAHRRPVLAVPGETAEIRNCYREASVPLREVDSPSSLAEALGQLGDVSVQQVGFGVDQFTWEAQGVRLETWFSAGRATEILQ